MVSAHGFFSLLPHFTQGLRFALCFHRVQFGFFFFKLYMFLYNHLCALIVYATSRCSVSMGSQYILNVFYVAQNVLYPSSPMKQHNFAHAHKKNIQRWLQNPHRFYLFMVLPQQPNQNKMRARFTITFYIFFSFCEHISYTYNCTYRPLEN